MRRGKRKREGSGGIGGEERPAVVEAESTVYDPEVDPERFARAVRSRPSTPLAPQGGDYLVGLREAPGLVLRVDAGAVGHDVEDAVGAFDQLGLDTELLLQRGRQTGGLGKEVSSAAVGDGHVHDGSSGAGSKVPRRDATRSQASGRLAVIGWQQPLHHPGEE